MKNGEGMDDNVDVGNLVARSISNIEDKIASIQVDVSQQNNKQSKIVEQIEEIKGVLKEVTEKLDSVKKEDETYAYVFFYASFFAAFTLSLMYSFSIPLILTLAVRLVERSTHT